MAKFLTRIEPTTTTNLDLAHYRLAAGFLDLPGDASPAGVVQDIRITCVAPSFRSSLLASLTRLVNNIHNEAKRNGGRNGVLTYMAFECLDDDVGVRILGRWREKGDMENFVRRGDLGAFWQGEKGRVSKMEQRCYVPNGKGWLHRGRRTGMAGGRTKM
jgi:hypothetical protein